MHTARPGAVQINYVQPNIQQTQALIPHSMTNEGARNKTNKDKYSKPSCGVLSCVVQKQMTGCINVGQVVYN